ncbi:hypothetical protein NL108_010450 [Boleophthalmus pectinirostris]|uniref:arrestin domain-containing protein 3-like n=1 Tax=Boleophthalmus pectinirostris TaxID=150288 RepID=UPI000A1C63A8|nr:arrestin domain-containing protein 3-like [Boleophthalmus pectinirostris]KAJ0067782.1 hypothetical protein NL108_010450 [Boleophthalmus pectinirostris]
MPSLKNFAITYDDLHNYGIFSEGDTVTGKVTLELEKQTKIESLSVKLKGDVKVHWTEQHGEDSHTYSANRRLFKEKHFLITQETKDTRLPAGVHIFKFSIGIPLGNMPSSFRGGSGKVVYKLEARLCRSWRFDRTDEKEICFRTKAFPNINRMNFQQVGSTNKEVGIFNKGTVQMDVTVDRRGYVPGDSVLINAKINNSSSKDATPKFSFIQDVEYRVKGNTKHDKLVICREYRECVKPQTLKEHTFSLTIPPDTPLSIQNCDILSVEYRIKASLDISFSFNPEIVFPVVLFWDSPHTAGGAIGGPSTSDFPAPVSFVSPYSSATSATSQYPASAAMYAGAPSMCSVPEQINAYGYPFSSSSSASVLHPPPPATLLHPPSSGQAHSQFSSTPPTYNTLEVENDHFAPLPSGVSVPSAPMMTENFLSQTDEEPPSYEILFPSSNGSNPRPK